MDSKKLKFNYLTKINIKHSLGFTLIEILVVLVILAVVAGMVIINVLPNDDTRLEDEAERLVQVLSIAGDYSRLSGKKLKWETDGKQYSFLAEEIVDGTKTDWRAVISKRFSADTFKTHIFPTTLIINSLAVNEVISRPGEDKSDKIYFYPSGVNVPFSITLSSKNNINKFKIIAVNPIGRVRIVGKKTQPSTTETP